MSSSAGAQVSPALGPPQAGPAAIPLQKIKFSVVIDLVESLTDSIVADINTGADSLFAAAGLQAKFSGRIQSILPSYIQTTFTNQPNQQVIELQMRMIYMLSAINYRGATYPAYKLGLRIMAHFSCENWQTGTGRSNISYTIEKTQPDKISFQDPALNFFISHTLIEHLCNKLEQALRKNNNKDQFRDLNQPCNCMSFKTGTGPVFDDGYAGFYYLPVRKIKVQDLYSDPQLRLLSVKRLLPDDESGAAKPGIQIEYMANYNSALAIIKPVQENETVYLKDDLSLQFEHPDQYNRLLIIVNLSLLNNKKRVLSGFLQFEKDSRYGEGLQKLTLMKKTVSPASPEPGIWMPAYELTFNISYNKPKTN